RGGLPRPEQLAAVALRAAGGAGGAGGGKLRAVRTHPFGAAGLARVADAAARLALERGHRGLGGAVAGEREKHHLASGGAGHARGGGGAVVELAAVKEAGGGAVVVHALGGGAGVRGVDGGRGRAAG